MKWIKYQIVCGKNQNEEDILINKKVGYSAENIAIAEKEAYNGYTIEEDAESFDKEPLAIELGGTHANNANDARKNLGALAAADYDGLFAKTGNPVQANLKKGRGISAITTILPAQSGSGTPYPAGGGKNLLPNCGNNSATANGITLTCKDGVYKIKGAATANTTVTLPLSEMITVPTGTYIHLGNPVADASIVLTLRHTSGTVTNILFSAVNRIASTADFEGKTIEAISVQVGTGKTVNFTFAPMIKLDSTATEYAPYANIRPISGWAGAKLMRCGKNLLPDIRISSGGFTSVGNGVFKYVSNNNTTISTFLFKAGITYTISATAVSGTGYKPCIIVRNPTGDRDGQKTNYGATGNPLTFSFDADTNFDIILQAETGNGLTTVNDSWAIQLELGSTATTYEPYQGDTYTADFGQTVYGGTLDWQTGVLTVDKAFVEYDGSADENWQKQVTVTSGYRQFLIVPGDAEPNTDSANVAYVVSNMYKATSPNGGYLKTTGICVNQNQLMIYDADRATLTVDGWKAWLSEHPVQIVYKLATPTTIQLTPQEMIEALDGLNTVYTDCGSNDVTFNHDLPLLNAVPKPTLESIGAASVNHTHTPESIGAAKSNHTHADFAYSEAEVNTGKTWIDGKPIYKKTIAITSTISAPTGVTMKVVGAILDIDVPIKIYGAVAYHSDNAPYTWYQLGSHVDLEDKMWTGSTISTATGQVKLYVSNLTIGSGYITVEYTKKTN